MACHERKGKVSDKEELDNKISPLTSSFSPLTIASHNDAPIEPGRAG